MTDHAYIQHGTPPGPMYTERVPLRHEYADRYLVRYAGRWRRVHIQVRRLHIVYKGEKITVTIERV